jgi:hypothetical protein
MIFSTFTPFAYAVKEPEPAPVLELSQRKDIGSCSGDVWLDQLEFGEYQKLREQTVSMITGIGNKEAAAQEAAAEKSGVATNPDAKDTKNIFIPDANAQPALLYDVIKQRALSPDSVCHLDNLFSKGRVTYATRLPENVRYCANSPTAAIPCETTLSSQEGAQLVNSVNEVQTALTEKNSDGTTKTEEEKAAIIDQKQKIFDALKDVTATSDTSKVETSEATMTMNADTNIFFEKSAAEWLDFINWWAPVDEVIMAVNIIALVRTLPVIGTSMKGLLGKAGILKFFKGVSSLKFAGGGANWAAMGTEMAKVGTIAEKAGVATAESVELGASMKILGTEAGRGARSVYQTGLQELTNGIRDSAVGEGINLGKTSTGASLGSTTSIMEHSYTPVFTSEGAGLVKEVKGMVQYVAGQDEVIDLLIKAAQSKTGLMFMSQANKIRLAAYLETDVGSLSTAFNAFAKTKGGKDVMIAQLEAAKAFNHGRMSSVAVSAINKLGSEIVPVSQDVINELAAISASELTKAVAVPLVKNGIAGGAKLGTLKALQEFKDLDMGGKFLKWLQTISQGGLTRTLYMYTQYAQTFIMGTVFVGNVMMAYPTFSAPGVLAFELNNKDANYASKKDELHFVEVKKTSGIPGGGRFLIPSLDKALSGLAGTEEELAGRELVQKVRNIQDILFILDEDALLPRDTTIKAVNVITPIGLDKWRFFSMSPGSTLIYNLEHPSGYAPAGKSALLMTLRNINVYGISGLPNTFFTVPLEGLVPMEQHFRDLVGTLALFAMVPATFRLTSLGSGVIAIAGGAMAFFGLQATISTATDLHYGPIIDPTKPVDDSQLCKNQFNIGDKIGIAGAKALRLALAGCGAKYAGVVEGPFFWIGLLCDFGQMAVSGLETNSINNIDEKLGTCIETNYEVLSTKDILDQQQLQTETNEALKPLKQEALNIFSVLSPQVSDVFSQLTNDLKMQAMNLQVHTSDLLATVKGKELYYVYFQDADVKWFQGPKCNIDLCSAVGTVYKCLTQNGYRLVNESGAVILDGAPQAASLRVKMDEKYMSIVQKVINVDKGSGVLFEVYPDPYKVTVKNNCLKQVIVNLTAMGGYSDQYQDQQITELFGSFEAIYTPKVEIWLDGKDVAVHFLEETKIGDVAFGAGEIFRFTNAHIKVYKDAKGTIEIVDGTGKVQATFELGSDGAIGFDNALMRSGFEQTVGDKVNSKYVNVYHIFLYQLTSADASSVSAYGMAPCTLQDGTYGFTTTLAMDDAQKQNQWNSLLSTMCMPDVIGELNSSIHFHKDGAIQYVTVTDPTGVNKTYTVLGFDASCGGATGGYKIKDPQSGEESCLSMDRGPQGGPEFTADSQAPIPLQWASGYGGAFMYDSNSGKISIKNEFPFSLSPSMAMSMGGLYMLTAGTSPTGRQTSETGAYTAQPTNILAALPWTPSSLDYSLIAFIVTLAGGLLFIRIRFKREKDT